MKKFLRICLAILGLYLIFCVAIGVIVAEIALHPHRRPLSEAEDAEAPAWAKEDGALLSNAQIRAADGVVLRAWEVDPEDSNGSAVLLLHGRGGNRLEMTNYADMLLAHGYGVLIPDARGHGSSGGQFASYGLLERNDIHQWVQWLIANRRPNCVYGFGESMGAAELLQSLEVEPGFCAIAAECPFSTFRESAYDRMGQPFHLGPWVGRTLLRPAVESAFLYAQMRYHVEMNNASPEGAVSGSRTPILLIHGQSDTNIPVRHSRRLARVNSAIALWELPNTGHSSAIDTSPLELEQNLVKWFSSHPSGGSTNTESPAYSVPRI